MSPGHPDSNVSLALVGAVVGAAILLVWGAITYVYRDAPRHGMNGDQWAGVVALTAGIGFFAYLLRRRNREPGSGSPEGFSRSPEDEK